MVARGKRAARRPWIIVRWIPRPEGAQYSVARFAGSVIHGNVIPGLLLAALAHPGLPSAAAPRLVDANIRTDRLPHDIAHFVVESELSLKHGLWGLLASGVMLPNARVVSGRLRPRAAERSRELMKEAGQHPTEAEVLVSFIMGIAAEGVDEDWPKVRSRLNEAWHPRHSQRGPISHDEVRRACQRLRETERQWEELTVGESMRVRWPLHFNKAINRTRNHAPI